MKPITHGLATQQKGSIRFLSESRILAAGSIVYREGDPADGFFQVLAGEVELVARDSKGEEVAFARARDGEIFGFAGALQGSSRRIATARATSTTSAIAIPVNPVEVFQRAFGAGQACLLLRNIAREACATLVRLLEQDGGAPRIAPQTPIPGDPAGTSENWLRTIEAAMPSGLVARLFGRKSWRVGETILAEGEVADAFHFLVKGSARAVRAAGGAPVELAVEAAPSTFGHLSFLSERPQPFAIVAASDATTTLFGRAAFDRFLEDEPDAALGVLDAILRLLGERVAREEVARRGRLVKLPERAAS